MLRNCMPSLYDIFQFVNDLRKLLSTMWSKNYSYNQVIPSLNKKHWPHKSKLVLVWSFFITRLLKNHRATKSIIFNISVCYTDCELWKRWEMSKTEKYTNTKSKVVVENFYKTTDKEAQKMLFNEQYARMINAKNAKL